MLNAQIKSARFGFITKSLVALLFLSVLAMAFPGKSLASDSTNTKTPSKETSTKYCMYTKYFLNKLWMKQLLNSPLNDCEKEWLKPVNSDTEQPQDEESCTEKLK